MTFGLAHFLVLDYTCFGMKFVGGPGQSLKISIFASLIVNLHIHCRNCPRRNILWSICRRMYQTWCIDPINNSNGRSLTDNEPFDTVNFSRRLSLMNISICLVRVPIPPDTFGFCLSRALVLMREELPNIPLYVFPCTLLSPPSSFV